MVILVFGYLFERVCFAASRTSWRLWMRTRCSTPDWAKDSAMERPMPVAREGQHLRDDALDV